MRLLPCTFGLALLALGLALPVARGAEFVLFKNIWGDVIVATDTTPVGRVLTPPTKEQPVYYRGLSLGCRLGSIPGDKEPNVKELNRFIADVLARQGYLDARPGMHEPSLFLVVQWGYLDPRSDNLFWFLGYNPDQDIGAPVFPGTLGPEVFRQGMRSRVVDTILQDVRNPIYGIIITAFEHKSARTPNPVIYWQTRIGLPTNGKSMTAALPAMMVAAGPAIGRPADTPVLLDTDKARQGTVTFGELKYFETENVSPDRQKSAAPK